MKKVLVATTAALICAIAFASAANASVKTCGYLNGMKYCVTKGKRYDRICTTVRLNSYEFTRCRKSWH